MITIDSTSVYCYLFAKWNYVFETSGLETPDQLDQFLYVWKYISLDISSLEQYKNYNHYLTMHQASIS